MNSSIRDQAIETLKANDRGGFTIPTPRLYPYQWNWDSAFAALGFAVFDRERAWLELETLFDGQWSDGMVPHIIFRRNDPDYFPGPAVWQTNTQPPSSGHSQPPVATSIVATLMEGGDRSDQEHARKLFPKLMAMHKWFYDNRDPDGTGLIGIVHPWESGRDNCPDWDIGMNNIVVPDDLDAYDRRDTGHIDAEQRPTTEQYDRFLTIVKFGRDCGWDHIKMAHEGPFFMADPCVNFILMRANHDLLKMAQTLGETNSIDQIQHWIALSDKGSQLLWNEAVGGFCAKDLRTGKFSSAITNATMLAFYAGAGSEAQRTRLLSEAEEIIRAVKFAFPSWDPRHDGFEAKRYWRGPVWAMMNYMIAQGLEDHGVHDMAARVRRDTKQLIDQAGFYEYFDPMTGAGCGGSNFTWTAAVRLALPDDERRSRAA